MNNKSKQRWKTVVGMEQVMIWFGGSWGRLWLGDVLYWSGRVGTCCRSLAQACGRRKMELEHKHSLCGVPRWKVEKCSWALPLDSLFLRLCADCVPCAHSFCVQVSN